MQICSLFFTFVVHMQQNLSWHSLYHSQIQSYSLTLYNLYFCYTCSSVLRIFVWIVSFVWVCTTEVESNWHTVIWVRSLSHSQAAKAQASMSICEILPLLLAISYGRLLKFGTLVACPLNPRQTVQTQIRLLQKPSDSDKHFVNCSPDNQHIHHIYINCWFPVYKWSVM